MLCHIERVCYGRSKGCVNDVHRESVLCVPYQEGVSVSPAWIQFDCPLSDDDNISGRNTVR